MGVEKGYGGTYRYRVMSHVDNPSGRLHVPSKKSLEGTVPYGVQYKKLVRPRAKRTTIPPFSLQYVLLLT